MQCCATAGQKCSHWHTGLHFKVVKCLACRIPSAVTLSTAVLVAAAAAEVAGEAGTQCPLDLRPDKIVRAE